MTSSEHTTGEAHKLVPVDTVATVIARETVIRTSRLHIIPATAPHVRAELESLAAFGTLIDADIPESWPPGQYDRDAQEFFLQSLIDGGSDAIGWFGWYALYAHNESDRSILIGCGGYLGPPTPDGTVEIGYSICPQWYGRGFATEMAAALAQHAAQLPNVRRVIAQTHESNGASVTVLQRSGFAPVTPRNHADILLFAWNGAVNSTAMP